MVFASVVAQLCYAILGVFAGMEVFDLRNPIRGLLILFAVVAFLNFPLGTVLSVYVLFYVYVINTAPALPVDDKENSEAIGESQ